MTQEGPFTGDMPHEIHAAIAHFLPTAALNTFSRTCKAFYKVTNQLYVGILSIPFKLREALLNMSDKKDACLVFDQLRLSRVLRGLRNEGVHLRASECYHTRYDGKRTLQFKLTIHGHKGSKSRITFNFNITVSTKVALETAPTADEILAFKNRMLETYRAARIRTTIRRTPGMSELIEEERKANKEVVTAINQIRSFSDQLNRKMPPNARIYLAKDIMQRCDRILRAEETATTTKRKIEEIEKDVHAAAAEKINAQHPSKKRRYE